LNNFKKRELISILLAQSISGIFATNQNYIFTEPPVRLLYLVISHSGVNDVSPSQVDGRPPVLTAISQSNGNGQTSIPHRIKTP